MVTKLYYFASKQAYLKWCKERKYKRSACEKAWTGPGYYYARSKSYISKHVKHLDLRRGKREGKGPWRHTHDLERLVRKVKAGLERYVRERARKIAEKKAAKAPKKLQAKLAKTVEARTAARAAKAASRKWTRSKAVRELADYLWRQIPRRYKRGKEKAWTYIAVLALAKAILDRAREKGVDPYQYDWKELIDWSLGYRYAEGVVREVLGKTAEETARELERKLKYYEELYGSGATTRLERELDEIARYELEHLDDYLGV